MSDRHQDVWERLVEKCPEKTEIRYNKKTSLMAKALVIAGNFEDSEFFEFASLKQKDDVVTLQVKINLDKAFCNTRGGSYKWVTIFIKNEGFTISLDEFTFKELKVLMEVLK